MAACQTLKQDGLHADFYQVDITNDRTIEDLKNYITTQYGGLDVLVNNAGVYHVRIFYSFRQTVESMVLAKVN